MKSSSFRRTATTGLAAIGLLGGSTLVGLANGSVAGAALPEGQTFTFTGAVQTYDVPGNVCAVTIDALGASGGRGAPSDDEPTAAAAGTGGAAGATITVTPGESLQVNVGGRGGDGLDSNSEGPTLGTPGPGGWNGGGDGGAGLVPGGGGGGASDVRQGGTGLSDRVVVAGGGGGSGGYSLEDEAPTAIGGVGGNPATPGGDGEQPDGEGISGHAAGGGGAGTETAGGAAGVGFFVDDGEIYSGPDGTAGALGQGGIGGGDADYEVGRDLASGGGGGGGLFGGGGGGATFQETAAGGGGGSSLGDTTTAGVHTGDGEVTITPSTECDDTPTTTAAPTTTVAAPTTTTPKVEAQAAKPVAARPVYAG